MKRFLLLFVVLLPLLGISQVDLVKWNLTNNGNVATAQGYVTATSITCDGSNPSYTANGLDLAYFTDGSLVHNRYFQITVKPTSGNTLSLSKLYFEQEKLNGGPTNFGIKYYISNGGIVPDNYNFFQNSSTWLVNDLSIADNTINNLTLNLPTLTSSQTLIIRFYARGASDYNAFAWRIKANTLKITGSNPSAVLTATADNATVIKNNFITINVLANDITPAANPISSVVIAQQSNNGAAIVNSDKSIKFTPTTNFTGATSFKYTIGNGTGSTSTATVNVNVSEAVSANLIVWNGSTTIPNVVNSNITSAALTTVGGATIATNEVGHFRFNNGFSPYFFNASKYIQFTATAKTGKTLIPTQFSFTYNSPTSNNSGPKKYQIKYSKDIDFPEDKTFILASETNSVLGSDTDVALSFPTGTTVLPTETLYVRVYFYVNSIDYTDFYLKHSNGGTTGPAIAGYVLDYDANALNANDDLATTNQSEPVNIDVRNNDTGYNTAAISITQPTDNSGTVILNTDNTLTFNPSDAFVGTTSFNYTISNGTTSATAKIYVYVLANNNTSLVIWNGNANPEVLNNKITAASISTVGMSSSNYYGNFRFNNLPTTSFDASKYIQFSTTANSSSTIVPSEFKFRYFSPSKNNSGPKKYQVKFSQNSNFPADETFVLAGETTAVIDSDTDVTLSFPASTEVLPTKTLYVRVYFYDNNIDYSDFYIRHDNGGNLGPAISGIVKNVATFTAKNDNVTTAGEVVEINVLSNDFIAPSQLSTTTISAVSTPSSGTAVINASTKKIIYTPVSGFTGVVNFTYTITNGTKFSSATVKVTVNEPIIQVTTWNGASGWSNGMPTTSKDAIIAADYQITSNIVLSVKNLTINADAKLTVGSEGVLLVQKDVTILANTEASVPQLIVENNGSFVQVENNSVFTGAANSFLMKRNTQPVYRLDFTYWSSPIKESSSFTLEKLSPTTLPSKYYKWNDSWIGVNRATEIMTPAKGYIVRAPQGFDIQGQPNATAKIDEVNFEGIPNNGQVKIHVNGDQKWNLIGNPYPSALNIDTFFKDPINESKLGGTIYLWTHNTPIGNVNNNAVYSYSPSDYASYNMTGGTGTKGIAANSESDSESNIPSGFVAAGQAFFVKGNVSGEIVFNNSMRVKEGGKNSQFFRPITTEPVENWEMKGKHRIWLNLTGGTNAFNQILVGYIEGATNGVDWSYDGDQFGGNQVTMYSILEAKNLTIQGRALPFSKADEVPLGYKTTLTGTLKIAIDHLDGQFEGKDIYLQDKVLNTVHNLKDSDYSFTTVPGTFNERFVLRYLPQETLGTENPTIKENSILVFNTNNQINVKSNDLLIDTVEIYDLQGRTIFTKNKVNAQTFATQLLSVRSQVVIVKIITDNRAELVKKVILR